MITAFSTHPRLTEEGRRERVPADRTGRRPGQACGRLLADRFANGRIAILHDGSTYGEGLAREARKQLRARGKTEVMYARYTPHARDYTDLLARLRQARIDVIYVGGYGPDAGLILRTARELGDDLRLIGGDGLGMDGFWSVAGDLGERTIFSDRPEVRDRPDAAAVLERFQSRGLGTRMSGLGAYAAVQVWAQAAERAGTFEPASVARMLQRGRFETVLGRVAFDGRGDLRARSGNGRCGPAATTFLWTASPPSRWSSTSLVRPPITRRGR